MKTYWNVAVHVDGICKCSLGDNTASAAISRALTDAVYYQAIYPGAKITIDDIKESCAGCHNEGTVRIKRPRSTKVCKCPECKGKKATGRLDAIPFTMPDPANRISLTQDALRPKVVIEVSGGVADWTTTGDVDVELIDHDGCDETDEDTLDLSADWRENDGKHMQRLGF